MAQYSTYIIKSENKYLIEANVLFNFKHIIEPGKLENYLGIMKMIDLHYYHEIEEVIQLKAKRKYNYQNEYTSKIIFEFSPTDLHHQAIHHQISQQLQVATPQLKIVVYMMIVQ